jgi:heat-inducible transcriptional repressor
MSANFFYNEIKDNMNITDRQKNILKTIIKEHIKTAQPISSGFLVEKCRFNFSPATIRNEMMALEEAGYIFQPHTSAGRVPTEAAYNLFVQEFIDLKRVDKNIESCSEALDRIFQTNEESLKQVAKMIAEQSGNMVFWAFHKNNLYHTGLSNLFAQEEFKQLNLIYDASGVIDRLEDIIDKIFNELILGQKVFIGSTNPFGNFLSTVLVKYNFNNQSGLFGILGPLRMDYEKNLALAKYIESKFKI